MTLLKKAVALEPGHAGTHLALADAFRAMGYTNEARREAADAVRLGAELPREELLNMQGELALLSNDTDRAIVFYRSLVTFYPDEVNYVLLLAQSQSEGSHSPDALGTLTAFRRPNTSPADEARLSLAEASVNLQLGNFREAVARATEAVQIGRTLGQKRVTAQGLYLEASGLERMSEAKASLAASAESEALYKRGWRQVWPGHRHADCR